MPRRAGGRTLIDLDPGKLSWVLLARESVDRAEQVGNQFTDLRAKCAVPLRFSRAPGGGRMRISRLAFLSVRLSWG
jgi:hypothetical protein